MACPYSGAKIGKKVPLQRFYLIAETEILAVMGMQTRGQTDRTKQHAPQAVSIDLTEMPVGLLNYGRSTRKAQ